MFRLLVISFTEMMVTDAALNIDKIVSGPVLVAEGAPDGVVAVDCDRIADLQIGNGVLYIADAFLKRKLRRVHAYDYESLISIFLCPRLDVGDRAKAVDAGIRPEIDQNHLAFETLPRQRRRVQPFHTPRKRRHNPLRRKLGGFGFCLGLARHHHASTLHHRWAVHDDGRPRLRVGDALPQLIDQPLFERRRVSERNARQKARIETKRDCHDASQHGCSQATPDPLPGAKKSLHGGEDPPSGEERQRK